MISTRTAKLTLLVKTCECAKASTKQMTCAFLIGIHKNWNVLVILCHPLTKYCFGLKLLKVLLAKNRKQC